MGYKERILEILDGKELTVKDIAMELGISENAVNVYIYRLRDKIDLIDKKGRCNVYTAKKQQKITNGIDTEIIKKMIPEFVKAGINLKTTTEIEDKRIMELIEECLWILVNFNLKKLLFRKSKKLLLK